MLKYGTGGINIDGCRVGNDKINVSGKGSFKEWQKEVKGFKSNEEGVNTTHFGRFPANLIHDGSDEVVELFPDTTSGKMTSEHTRHTNGSPNGIYGKFDESHSLSETIGDSGSAARFFYTAKASQSDRDEGLDGFEATNVNDVRDTPIDNAFQRGETLRKNIHPTVKPTDLMQYLVRLITPKGGVVLDPFMGSGSTGKATMIENVLKGSNYHFIGVDITEEYLPIAQARIEQGIHFEEREVTTISTDDQGNKVKQVQTSIFDFLADD